MQVVVTHKIGISMIRILSVYFVIVLKHMNRQIDKQHLKDYMTLNHSNILVSRNINNILNCVFRLINKLLEHVGMPPVGFRSKAKMSFVMMANVEGFNKAAMAYGVPEGAIFQTVDLVDGRKANMVNVINCINQLGVLVSWTFLSYCFEIPFYILSDRNPGT